MLTLKQWGGRPNAGDVWSTAIVAHLTGEEIHVVQNAKCEAPNLVACGSILHWADQWSTVWGTGLVAPHVTLSEEPRRVSAVRGPLTQERLEHMGISAPRTLGDPGVFAPDVFPYDGKRSGIGLVPHYVDGEARLTAEWSRLVDLTIDPALPLQQYFSDLASCEIILSSSLHGIVFAHAYGIPAVWVRISDGVHGAGFKFRDYFASVGLDVDPVDPRRHSDIQSIIQLAILPRTEIDKDALAAVLREHVDFLSRSS